MTISTLIGHIDKDAVSKSFRIRSEKFYAVPMSLLDADIRMLISEYMWKEPITGKVKVEGYLTRIPVYRGNELCFRAVNIEPASEESPVTNEVIIAGTLSKKMPYMVTKNGVEIQPMVITLSPSHTKQPLNVWTVAKDANARYWRSVEEGSELEDIHGYLKCKDNSYTIILKRPKKGGN